MFALWRHVFVVTGFADCRSDLHALWQELQLRIWTAAGLNQEKAIRTTDFADGTDEEDVALERAFIRRVSEESLPSFADAVIIRVIRTLCLKIFAERANSLERKGARTLGRFSVRNTSALVGFADLVGTTLEAA